MRTEKRPEILAPAGSMDGLRAAVAAGCDAVYIGGSRFGARAYADNPQGDEMTEAIRYCHLHGVKIYLTVNTLLKDRELYQELYEYLLPYYQEGLDAVIVQDVGVMRYIHRCFPDLEIHASTQMTLTMGVSTRLLEDYGVTRIVPARELTLAELEQMRQDTGMELEVFVHGALCYCYSGQCLFSSMLGGRSGNRGRCAQPCRMPYTLQGGQGKVVTRVGKYLLSPKENCNLAYVGPLIEAGVDSFKIEGRMKRPEYTAFTTAMYRKYVDLYMELGKEGYAAYLEKHQEQWLDDIRKLGELYNRTGFTAGYLEGKSGVPYEKRNGTGQMLSSRRPKHGGIKVGKVLSVDKHTVTYELEKDLHPQDVVEFRDREMRPVYEYTLGEGKKSGQKVTARYQKGSRPAPGSLVYRTRDAELLEKIREEYLQKEAKEMLRCTFLGREEMPMVLRAEGIRRDGKMFSVELQGAVCQRAQKQPAMPEDIRKLICQTGDTPFVVTDCQVELQGQLFIPVGAVKKLRRDVLGLLQEQMEGDCRRADKLIADKDCDGSWADKSLVDRECAGGWADRPVAGERYDAALSEQGAQDLDHRRAAGKETMIVSVLSWEQLEAALESPAVDKIYLKMDEMTDQEIKEAVRTGDSQGKAMYLVLPAVFRNAVYQSEKKKLSSPENIYQLMQLSGYVVRNMESFVFLREEVKADASRIIPDYNLYVANQEAYAYWREQGCKEMTLPLELTGRELQTLSAQKGMQAVIYGCIPLMVSAQCVRYNTMGCEREDRQRKRLLSICDGKQRQFVVFNACKYCYNVIYQKEPLVLEKEQNSLREQGVGQFRYDFSIESGAEVKNILAGNLPEGQTGHFYTGVE